MLLAILLGLAITVMVVLIISVWYLFFIYNPPPAVGCPDRVTGVRRYVPFFNFYRCMRHCDQKRFLGKHRCAKYCLDAHL